MSGKRRGGGLPRPNYPRYRHPQEIIHCQLQAWCYTHKNRLNELHGKLNCMFIVNFSLFTWTFIELDWGSHWVLSQLTLIQNNAWRCDDHTSSLFWDLMQGKVHKSWNNWTLPCIVGERWLLERVVCYRVVCYWIPRNHIVPLSHIIGQHGIKVAAIYR